MALGELITRDHPPDPEASPKLKNIAANETITRGSYAGVVGAGPADGPARVGRLAPENKADKPDRAEEPEAGQAPPAAQLSPAHNRVAREVAVLRGRLQADPT